MGQRDEVIASCIKNFFANRIEPVKILDAGCGKEWNINLGNIPFQIIGVDYDKKVLEIRQAHKNDLAIAIVGNLSIVAFKSEEFDCIYCFNVTEHLRDVKRVIDSFFEWLKPQGLLVLVFPDRDTVFSFLARLTPFWFHIWYYKHICGRENAGKPGFGPHPPITKKLSHDKEYIITVVNITIKSCLNMEDHIFHLFVKSISIFCIR